MEQAPLDSLNRLTVDLINTTSKENLLNTIIRNCTAEIYNYSFHCVVSHINTLHDFYVQKVDEPTSELLLKLQSKIQEKVATNQVTNLEKISVNKLCIAYFNDDENYYRAKIVRYNSNTNIIKDINKDLEVEVFYVDYGMLV